MDLSKKVRISILKVIYATFWAEALQKLMIEPFHELKLVAMKREKALYSRDSPTWSGWLRQDRGANSATAIKQLYSNFTSEAFATIFQRTKMLLKIKIVQDHNL